jgi:Kef-type K+ transport system membrane component KefB
VPFDLFATVGLPTPTPLTAPAAAEGATITVLAGLLVLLVGAKLGEEVARRLGQPAVVGELFGGFLVGPHALALVTPGETATVLAEVGVVILLFAVGLEVRLDDLLAVGRTATAVATIAMVLPIAAGLAVGLAVGEPAGAAAFIGLALAATSIGITSRVLTELRVLNRAFSRVVLGAAVIDDVLALIAIGLVVGAVQGDLGASTLFVALAAVGLVLLGFAAARRARGLRREVFTWPLFAETPLVPAFILMLTLAIVAGSIGLAAIIGAFVAGLIVAETEARHELEEEIRPLSQIFTPFFFAVTGSQVDLAALLDPTVAGLALVLAAVGIATKAVGGLLGARSLGSWGAATVGFGMVPRGEVGIVVANLGLGSGLFSGGVFAAVVVAVVLTTVVAPYLLAWSIPRAIDEAAVARPDRRRMESPSPRAEVDRQRIDEEAAGARPTDS